VPVLRYLIKRVFWAVFVLFAVSIFTFVIFFIVPADQTRFGRGTGALELSLRENYGLEELSLPSEHAHFVWNLVRHGTFGESYESNTAVIDILAAAIPVTASLVVGGAILFLLLAVPIGIVSALRPRSLVDRGTMLFVLIGVSAHPAWIGLVLSYFLGFKWHITPISGYCDFFNPVSSCGGGLQWAHHLVLPWLTFAILFAGLYARMIRANILESIDEDYVRTARAKGAPEWLVLRSHVLRNAMLPVVTMLGMDVGIAFGGAIFIENVYSLPGVGRIVVAALLRRDLPVILGVVLFVTFVIVVLNLIVDLLYAWLDPRVRVSGEPALGKAEQAPRAQPSPQPVPTGPTL